MNQRFSFNQGWRFARGYWPKAVDPAYPTEALATWDPVTLPHTPRYEPYANGDNPTFQGQVMYRKHFPTPQCHGKLVFLEFEAVMAQIAEHYHHLTELLYERQLAALPEEQRREKSACTAARKRAIEDARYVLPNACDTKLIFTMNARSLFNFFRHRCCNRAQWEIRRLAEEMFRLVYAVAPTVFEGAGPACVREGRCPEGKMSCGRMEEMRRRYAAFREGEG